MRHSMSTLLTTLLLTAAILPAAAYAQGIEAEPTSLNSYITKQPSTNQFSPFNLAYLAYQGYLQDQGIPSNGALIDAIASRKITAQDLIQAAVKTHRLPEQVLNDQGYHHDLENQLKELTED
jgi:hypothetical protein